MTRAVTILVVASMIGAQTTLLSAQSNDSRALFDRISWSTGPADGPLGTVGQVRVPPFCRFTGEKGAKTFMEATENPPSGNEVGVLLCASASDSSQWFVVFSYDASGLVRDDEKGKLDQAAILSTIQRGTEAGNKERRQRGWEEIEVAGWERAPYYDTTTRNLTWSTRVKAKGASEVSVNHSVRLLGRGGVMHADLVAGQEELASAVAAFDGIVSEFEYLPGSRYSEWREGDKVAEYGLTALIAGGAGAAAVKLGLFGKMWKFIVALVLALKKLIIVGVLAVVAFVKRLFGGKTNEPANAGVGGDTSK
ncbi:MAG TPA: DUF2167 domain-containing protein [Gemmatimonadaceae bacterium]